MKKVFVLLGVLLIIMLVGCSSDNEKTDGEIKTVKITQKDFNKLKEGMTPEEVKDVVGGEPGKTSDEESGLLEYEYEGQDGIEDDSYALLIFKDNRLNTIIEEGLIPKSDKKKADKGEPTQEELDEKLKKEAVPIDWVKAVSDEIPEGTKVYGEGEVDDYPIDKDDVMQDFGLSIKYGEDEWGVFEVRTFTTLPNVEEVQEGDIAKVYGTYAGKHEVTGLPLISATIVEKK